MGLGETEKIPIQKVQPMDPIDYSNKLLEFAVERNTSAEHEKFRNIILEFNRVYNQPTGTVELSNKISDSPDMVINSMFEPDFFSIINPFSDIPIIAILSGSIILILLSIQCLNFIVGRLLLIKFAPQIEKLLINRQFLKKWFEYVINIVKKVSLFYYISFTICIYVLLLMTVYYLYLFLDIVSKFY